MKGPDIMTSYYILLRLNFIKEYPVGVLVDPKSPKDISFGLKKIIRYDTNRDFKKQNF